MAASLSHPSARSVGAASARPAWYVSRARLADAGGGAAARRRRREMKRQAAERVPLAGRRAYRAAQEVLAQGLKLWKTADNKTRLALMLLGPLNLLLLALLANRRSSRPSLARARAHRDRRHRLCRPGDDGVPARHRHLAPGRGGAGDRARTEGGRHQAADRDPPLRGHPPLGPRGVPARLAARDARPSSSKRWPSRRMESRRRTGASSGRSTTSTSASR